MYALSQIWIYPVKSLRGIQVASARATPTGLEYDRQWMLVDVHGVFLTQREHPGLARMSTALQPHALTLSVRGATMNVPLHCSGSTHPVRVWRDTVEAIPVGALADDWLRREIGLECRLVWLPPATHRSVDPQYGQAGDQTSFADGFPYLLTGEAALEELNARLDQPVPMTRFRPNLVFSGGSAHEEDGWRDVQIGEVNFRRAKDCVRCVVTTTDQETGERQGPEPLRTMAQYRNLGKGVVFGQNLVPRGSGTLQVGDILTPGLP